MGILSLNNSLISFNKSILNYNNVSLPTPQKTYGALYNSFAAFDSNFAPTGWHVSTYNDWISIFTFMATNVGGKLKETGTSHWNSPNTNATDQYGLSLLPGGFIPIGVFFNINISGYYWTKSPSQNYIWKFNYYDGNADGSESYHTNKGCSIRMVRDSLSGYVPGEIIYDNDGNAYGTTQIGSLVWTTNNWKSTKYNNGNPITYSSNINDWTPPATTPLYTWYNFNISNK